MVIIRDLGKLQPWKDKGFTSPSKMKVRAPNGFSRFTVVKDHSKLKDGWRIRHRTGLVFLFLLALPFALVSLAFEKARNTYSNWWKGREIVKLDVDEKIASKVDKWWANHSPPPKVKTPGPKPAPPTLPKEELFDEEVFKRSLESAMGQKSPYGIYSMCKPKLLPSFSYEYSLDQPLSVLLTLKIPERKRGGLLGYFLGDAIRNKDSKILKMLLNSDQMSFAEVGIGRLVKALRKAERKQWVDGLRLILEHQKFKDLGSEVCNTILSFLWTGNAKYVSHFYSLSSAPIAVVPNLPSISEILDKIKVVPVSLRQELEFALVAQSRIAISTILQNSNDDAKVIDELLKLEIPKEMQRQLMTLLLEREITKKDSGVLKALLDNTKMPLSNLSPNQIVRLIKQAAENNWDEGVRLLQAHNNP